jgi:hypothetical protein
VKYGLLNTQCGQSVMGSSLTDVVKNGLCYIYVITIDAISMLHAYLHANCYRILATLGSRGSAASGSQDSANWRLNLYLLPLWNEGPLCRCSHVAIIDTWDIGMDQILVVR